MFLALRTLLPIHHAPYAKSGRHCALPVSLAVQVVVSPLIHGHPPVAAEDADLEQCTQIPITQARKGLSRLKKHEHLKANAEGGDTTPSPQGRKRSMKLPTLIQGLMDPQMQTPMPKSQAASEFGPPPLDSTPHNQRKWIRFQPITT